MDWYELAFYLFALLILGSAAVVAFAKNIMYAAFGLLFTLFGVAGFYVLLTADFIAITQIMIYIGGILVLIIFGVMMTMNVLSVEIKTGTMGKVQGWVTGIIVLIGAILLSLLFINVDWHTAEAQELESTIEPIGTILMTEYLLAFEVASVLLLIAIIGAALIARRRKSTQKSG